MPCYQLELNLDLTDAKAFPNVSPVWEPDAGTLELWVATKKKRNNSFVQQNESNPSVVLYLQPKHYMNSYTKWLHPFFQDNFPRFSPLTKNQKFDWLDSLWLSSIYTVLNIIGRATGFG